MALTKVTGQVIKNTTDVTVGVLTVTNTLAVGGTVSIGGTLTYEDVTNVDAVGLITARNGIVVGSGITLSKDGDIFATGVTTTGSLVSSGAVSGTTGTFSGAVSGTTGTFSGAVSGTTGTFTGNVAVSGANITLQDSGGASDDRLVIGAGSDLSIYHDGSNSRIENSTGQLKLKTNNSSSSVQLIDHNDNAMVQAIAGGVVSIAHNNSTKFETSSSGITVSSDNSTGSILKGVTRFTPNDSTTVKVMWDEGGFSGAGHFQVKDGVAFTAGDSSDLQIYHDSTRSHIVNSTDELRIRGNDVRLMNAAGNEHYFVGFSNSYSAMYYDNTQTIQTTTGGAQILNGTGDAQLNIRGGSSDGRATLQFISDDNNANNDNFRLRNDANNDFYLQNYSSGSWETNIKAVGDGAVDLYHDNTIRGSTNADGFRVNGALQSSSGTGNYYLRTAHTTIQEGGNSVTITLSGLTFSFGVFRIGGYASAGQASVSLHIIFGGYMTHTSNYNATVLANHAQGCSISQTKNNSNYVITITNNANNYDLFCNMMIESANSAFAMTLS